MTRSFAGLAGLAALGCGQPAPCPVSSTPTVLGPVDEPSLIELSGIARGDRWWWAHNDADSGGQIYALSDDGAVVGAVRLRGVEGVDFEDIAVERRAGGETLVWVGDIGDNEAERDAVGAYGFVEPAGTLLGAPTVDVQAVVWRYPGGLAHDAETLLIDPLAGERYVITRGRGEPTQAFVVEAGGLSREMAAVDAPALVDLDANLTAGDVSADGAWVAVRSSGWAWLWARAQGEPLSTVWQRSPDCTIELVDEPQGEGLGFSEDGLLTASEGEAQPLHLYPWLP
jgi:hypothetical protein